MPSKTLILCNKTSEQQPLSSDLLRDHLKVMKSSPQHRKWAPQLENMREKEWIVERETHDPMMYEFKTRRKSEFLLRNEWWVIMGLRVAWSRGDKNGDWGIESLKAASQKARGCFLHFLFLLFLFLFLENSENLMKIYQIK